MNNQSMNYFLIAFKQETMYGPVYSNYRWIKAVNKEDAIMICKTRSLIPPGIYGDYVVIREGLTKKEDVPTKT